MDELEQEIAKGQRRRIFEEHGKIELNPETIRGVVKKLQDFFLFGIDADLNGRLFETFLNATMRGKDLGQFFTPRSVVELGVGLAQIKVGTKHGGKTEIVIDACCGTGGFLIDALADMWEKADKKAISDQEKDSLKHQIANNHIIGIDVANAPKLARIARLNMYLHGDGGSRIFHLNALDKDIPQDRVDQPEIVREKQAFRDLVKFGEFADVALTNPPFAKAIERTSEGEKRILDQYEIGRVEGGLRGSVRSCLLFAERYHDLLKVGGRLVTVIDDGILSGDEYQWFRDKLREWFIIRAVVSLPGDAFQRSNARVKTSYLVAEKRDPDREQEQPPVFMYPCQYVGIDDAKRQRARPGDDAARQRAVEEVDAVISEYEAFQSGDATRYVVAADRIFDRLDVKNCMMTAGRAIKTWEQKGFHVLTLESVLEPRSYPPEDIITKDCPYPVRVLIVRYEGLAESGDEIMPSDSSYARFFPVRANDIVISNIAATYGSIAIVPDNLDGCVVSNEYTVLQAKEGYDPIILQLILRSPEIRSDILLSASGANRTRARWASIKDIMLPYPGSRLSNDVVSLMSRAEDAKKEYLEALEAARERIETSLFLRSTEANIVLSAFKPPK